MTIFELMSLIILEILSRIYFMKLLTEGYVYRSTLFVSTGELGLWKRICLFQLYYIAAMHSRVC